MARANRHHLPGYVWHVTHRCHKREFLLKFDKDKKRWSFWLFEAKRRFELIILLGIKDSDQLIYYHRKWVEDVLKSGSNQRDTKWTQSIAACPVKSFFLI